MRGLGAAWALCALLWAGLAGAAEFATDPATVRLGETASAAVTFELPGCEGAKVRPMLAVNVGTFENIHRVGADRYQATYLPPSTRFPQVALVAVYCDGPVDTPLRFVRIPLHGQTRLPVTTRPGNEVRVEVGEEVFGPQKADGKGRATLDVYVPPGVKEAVVLSRDPKSPLITQARVGVDVPPYNRLTVAAATPRIANASKEGARVEAFYDGAPEDFSSGQLVATVSQGSLVVERESGGHVFFRYAPPGDGRAATATIDLAVKGDPASTAKTEIALLEPEAAQGRVSVGPRVGFNHSLREVAGPRIGVDAWMPFALFGRSLAGGLSVSIAGATQPLTDPLGGGAAHGSAGVTLVPASLTVGYELIRGKQHWVHAGLGAAFAYARYSAEPSSRPDTRTTANGYGGGGLGFVAGGYGIGPGHAFAELSYTYLPVRAPSFRVDAGGLFLSAGYRFAVLE